MTVHNGTAKKVKINMTLCSITSQLSWHEWLMTLSTKDSNAAAFAPSVQLLAFTAAACPTCISLEELCHSSVTYTQ